MSNTTPFIELAVTSEVWDEYSDSLVKPVNEFNDIDMPNNFVTTTFRHVKPTEVDQDVYGF